jgi:type IV fimbrial biogenesis protein FimT
MATRRPRLVNVPNLQDTAPMKKSKGFTLIELMIVIFIIGILMSVAAPGFRTYLSNIAANSLGNTLLIDIMYARNHAISNTVIVKMVPFGSVPGLNNRTGASTYTPASAGVNWGLGWVIFVDTNNNNVRDNNEFIIRQKYSFGPDAHVSSGPGAQINSGTVAVLDANSPIGFNSLGFPTSVGVLSIAVNGCAGSNGQYIQINQIGQVSSRGVDCPIAFTNL